MDNISRRVKVYQLNDDGQWDDKGTGFVSCAYVQQVDGVCLVVNSEENGNCILESKIPAEDIYQRQQETLIVWSEPETSDDLALSFQDPNGCNEVWEQITHIQTRLRASNSPVDEYELLNTQEAGPPFELPAATTSNIEVIHQLFTQPIPAHQKEKLIVSILKENYLAKLITLFKTCEESNNLDLLYKLHEIFRSLVMFNDISLLEVLLDDEFIMDVMGALEYDPELKKTPMKHREFLTNRAIFKEVIPFGNPEIVKKIHQTYRIQYLKDVVLPRSLDDQTFASLNSLIYYNHIEIISAIQKDKKFLTDLFTQLNLPDNTTERWKELVMFLQELCNLATKNLQPPNRTAFYGALSSRGLFELLEKVISDQDVNIRLSGIEICSNILLHDPSLLRKFIVSQKPDHNLMKALIVCLTSDKDVGIIGQVAEILRTLFDTETMDEANEKEDFLNVFYKNFIQLLIKPLKEKEQNSRTAAVQNHVCELLAFCLQHHGYRIKYFVLGQKLTERVVKLLKHPQKYLALSAIRYFRAMVGLQDDFYQRFIVKHNLFDPIIEAFENNGSRYNLLNSAIIELFEFIRQSNFKILVAHIVETYRDRLQKIDYVDTFKNLILRYEQNMDKPDFSTPATNEKKRRLADSDDESYFRESSSEEEKQTNDDSKSKIHLVPYDDDEEESKKRITTDKQTTNETKQISHNSMSINNLIEDAKSARTIHDRDTKEEELSPKAAKRLKVG